jgi:hypothetical protein
MVATRGRLDGVLGSNGMTTKQSKAQMYLNFLREQKYRCELDEDGDVRITFQGLGFVLFADEEDREFFRLVLPNIWQSDSSEEHMACLAAANETTRKMKGAMVFCVGDRVWASIEMFLDPIETFKPVLERCLECLAAARHEFADTMRALEA